MSPSLTVHLAPGIVLQLDESTADDVRRQLVGNGDVFATALPTVPAGSAAGLILDDDHPLWGRHDGGSGHFDKPEWVLPDDLAEAEAFYLGTRGRGRKFFDLLIDHPILDADEICALAPESFISARAVAGSINGLRKAYLASGRRYPFYWWEDTPTRYAMKPSVRELFRRARTNVVG